MKKIIITGNLGKDPEGRHSPSGEWFVTFAVAVSVGTKSNPRTDWVDVSCNGRLAEVAHAYLKKGSKVLVEGFPSTNAYINNEGKAVATMRVVAKNLEILSSKEVANVNYKDNNSSKSTESPLATDSNLDSNDDFANIPSDDIPF